MNNLENFNSVETFLNGCDSNEINEIITYLRENNYLNKNHHLSLKNKSYIDVEWEKIIDTLAKGRLRLSNEDENIIKQISNKL